MYDIYRHRKCRIYYLKVRYYGYYQEHKEELLKVTTENGRTAWFCSICGYVYYGEELPENFKCPVCGVGKELFHKKD